MSANSPTPAEASPNAPPPVVRRKSNRTAVYAIAAVLAVVVVVVLVGVSAGWFAKQSTGGGAPGACPTGLTLLGAGASFITPIMNAWEAGYKAASGNTISYSPSGAGSGITSLQDSQVDFAATDNPVNHSTLSAFKGQVLTFPITAGALAIVYNLPGLTTPLKLSGPTVADIYLGLISNWNDSRITANNTGFAPGNQPILPTVRSDPAGTTYVLSDFLSQDSPRWASQVGKGISVGFPKISNEVGQKGNSGVLNHVLATKYSVGYVDLTDVLNAHAQYAQVLNPAGVYIVPTLADTASAIANISATTKFPSPAGDWNNMSMVNSRGTGDYPLATFAYLFVYQDDRSGYQPSVGKSQAIDRFLNWTVTDGQADATSLSYVTLPSTIVTLDQSGFQTLTFDGAALPGCH